MKIRQEKKLKKKQLTTLTSGIKLRNFGKRKSKDKPYFFYSSIKLLAVRNFWNPLTTSTCPIESNANVITISHCPIDKLVK